MSSAKKEKIQILLTTTTDYMITIIELFSLENFREVLSLIQKTLNACIKLNSIGRAENFLFACTCLSTDILCASHQIPSKLRSKDA
jgi:hypothetical protein